MTNPPSVHITTADHPSTMMSVVRKIFGRIQHILLIIFIPVSMGLVACSQPKGDSQQIEFEKAVGAKIEPDLLLLTSKSNYNAIDHITFQGINRTDRPIYFADSSMGVKAFQYDMQSSEWIPIEIGATIADPSPLKMERSKISNEPYVDSFSVDSINGSGAIRLTINGWTDPSSPKNSMVTTYQDIYIDKTNPKYFGNWTKSGPTKWALPDGDKNAFQFDFEGGEISVSFYTGPDYGATEVIVDKTSKGLYCNYDANIYGNNDILFSDLEQGKSHRLEIFPREDKKCSPQNGYTQVRSLEPN